MAGCPSHLIQFRLPCAPHKRRRKTIRRLKVLEKNQTKICRFFTRIGNHSFTDFHRLPGTVEVKSCPADTQRSQEENKLSYRRHSQWMRTWMDTRLHQDPKHKRSLDLTTNRSSVSKRRLTFAELEPHAEDVGKENAIVGLFTRHRRPQEPGGFPPNMQRQKLCEIPRPQTEWNKQSNVPTSTSGSQKVDAQCSCTVEKVIQLDLLSLSDDKRVAQARSAWSRKHAKSIPSTLEVVPVQTREHALRVCENTRLLGTMFHYPVSATLVQDSERSTPTHRGSEGSRLNSHIRTRNTLSFWLPRSPVDDVRLDEFHQNHERVSLHFFVLPQSTIVSLSL
ncbi:unnamed protein product [Dicrocoelium dendriticum]|nr:unnamed protein product [Dicrocoelium dendriticum]